MTRFEDELRNNNFVCSYCIKCQHFVWPTSEFCNKCLGDVEWRQVSKSAKLVEVSSKDGKYFCIAEFEGNIRVFGSLLGTHPKHDQNLTLEKCNYGERPQFVFKTR